MSENGHFPTHAPTGEFSVAVFYPDESHEYIARWIDAATAVAIFKAETELITAYLGLVRRVIITDGGDETNAEWKFGEGVTYPLGVQRRQ